MIKISALNDESEEENDSELKISAEALLQIASQQYAKALDLHRKGKLTEATQLLKDLLDTELLYNVKLPGPGEVPSGPLYNLKYLCYKNLAFMLQEAGNVEPAIEAYMDASELDDTDVTLWYRLGLLCLQAKQYEQGLLAFQRGTQRNPRHWPCIDNIIKLLLGLNYKEHCISVIHEALQLDPGYLRGIVYRRHIYTVYKHMRQYMEDLNPIYKWNENDDNPVDETIANKLLKEAEDIYESFIEQQKAEKFVHVVPRLKLKKPIIKQTWECVGESLVHMHKYMTEHYYSHACFIDIVSQTENVQESMELCEEENQSKIVENKLKEANTDNKKEIETVKENEDLSDKDKTASVNEKVESDIETVASEIAADINMEDKSQKRNSVRRRGSALSSLNTWEWFTRSGPRKACKQNNIYDKLRKLVPLELVPEILQKKENETKESSPDVSDIDKTSLDISVNKVCEVKEMKTTNEVDYFGSEAEQKDVKAFINLYTENSKDIIDMLYNYLEILSGKWNIQWSEKLSNVFVEANECYNNHIDVPSCTDDNTQNLIHYSLVNILAEELKVNVKLREKTVKKITHELDVITSIDIIITSKPHIFNSPSCLEMILRLLWVKLHVYIFLNDAENFALEISYELLREFEAMGDYCDTFSLNIINFTFKPDINEKEILLYIQMLERNIKLLSVMDLYNQGCYEDVIAIITESFDECKKIAKNREHELPLNFAVQLTIVLESYYASEKVNSCFKWSFISLHEALRHYFHFTSGTDSYELWALVIIKILSCMEHILNTEGLSCLETVTQKELSQGLEDLIRIISHQVETNASDMPFNTYAPCIIMHYILQREEDLDRGRAVTDVDAISCDEVPYPLMVLFLVHEYLGEKSWCCNFDGEFLYFILDTVVPRLRSPLLSKCLENICQYMEQVVFCLYAHPSKINNKTKHLRDHKVPAKVLNWERAQQIYEIFRPTEMPALEGKSTEVTNDTELLFNRILTLLPQECDPDKYVSDMNKYLEGNEEKCISITQFFPFKMKDIYLFLGDYFFKKEDHEKAIRHNLYDVILNSDRFNSWAQISLSKVFLLDIISNKCEKLNNDKEYLTPAKSAIRCFKRALQLNPRKYSVWVEFGNFVYNVHSFCSRLLKQDSESLSMEEFGALEKQKEDLLGESNKCYTKAVYAPDSSNDSDDTDPWFLFYMLGKVAEKRNKPPSVYLNFYMQSIKSLHDSGATYPNKIIYKSPSQHCIKVLELHYRMHASILKYIEQHENKPIPALVGKVFVNCIDGWMQGPFSKKNKENVVTNTPVLLRNEVEIENKCEELHAANILKRSISDAGEEDTQEVKRLKIEAAAAKIRRSASYDTECFGPKEPPEPTTPAKETKEDTILDEITHKQSEFNSSVIIEKDGNQELSLQDDTKVNVDSKKEDSSTSSSSTSSSDSNSSNSSSNSSSDSSSDSSSKSSQDSKQLTDEEIMKIVAACLDALENCASRYPPHYKAIYRLAHYHFYYKKGRDIERCRDLMLSTFISRSGQKMCGLFSERKANHFFNNIWKFPVNDIERAGGFGFHMNRCVLLTLEILKEIDDHKTLLDLSLHLQIEPDSKKKYLRDSDREDLAQQAFSLCTQSLKGQLLRFSQQSDLKTNEVERNALKSFMMDIYKVYHKVQRTPNSKHITALLIDAYKLISTSPITENMNLVDLSMKYCQSLNQSIKQQPMASIEKSQNVQKKQSYKYQSTSNSVVAKVAPTAPSQSKVEAKPSSTANVSSTAGLPKISAQEMAAAFQSYVPMLNDISQQTAAALSLSYLNNINALAGLTTLQNTMQSSLQTSLQNSYQAELYRQLLGTGFPTYNMPQQKKPKRGRPVGSTMSNSLKSSKSFSNTMSSLVRAAPLGSSKSSSMTSVSKASSFPKAAPASVITSLQKTTANPLTPSMGTVLSTLPASMTANLSSFGAHSSHTSGHSSVLQSPMTSSASTQSKASIHQQVSPSKTLQEKLAERQKNIPSVPKTAQEIYASLNRLPSSLTITKNSVSKHPVQGKKPEAKKSLSFGESEARPKPITTDEVIVLDDD